MRRVVSHVAILFGCLTLVVVGMLTYARRDAPPDWIIFSINQRYNNDFDIYRVLSDGTHTKRFAFTSDEHPSMSRLSNDSTGWLMLYDRYRGQERLRFLHLLGYQEVMNYESSVSSMLHYDRESQIIYLSITDDWLNNRTLWVWDLKKGYHLPYELPFKLGELRAWLDGEGLILWSDHASAGDLYSVSFTNPPKVKRLTTHGKVLIDPISTASEGWLYYLVGDGDPDPYNHLYRIRTDGTDEELVAEQVLNPVNAIFFGSGDPTIIYYWAGANENPHLVQARPDGTEAVDLPIPVIYGWGRGWSSDYQWMYYSESSPDMVGPQFLGGNLRRINMKTGESQMVWELSNLQQMVWSADRTWLILLTTDQQSGYSSLYKTRPDGSDVTLLADNLRGMYLEIMVGVKAVAYTTWGEVGKELHILDLQTLEIRPLHDDAPPGRMRQLLTTLPMPEFDWQAGWLVGIGAVLAGAGVASTLLPPFRPRT